MMPRSHALQMPVLLLLLQLLVSLLIPSVDSYNEELINGVAGARHVDLNHFTLAGAHNAGSGSFGTMWHSYFRIFTVPAVDCFYRNQDRSITQMLDLGIRYFDWDVTYVQPMDKKWWEFKPATEDSCEGLSNGHSWETGIVLIHADARSKPLKLALIEIDTWLGDHENEIVAMRISNHPSCADNLIRENIEEEFNDVLVHTGLNSDRNPFLGSAIDSNKRVVMFIDENSFGSHPNMHNLAQVNTWKDEGSTWIRGCWTVEEIIHSLCTRGRNKIENTYYQVLVDWYFPYGLCLKELAGLCADEFSRLVEVNRRLNRRFKRPVNLVMIDYVGHGVERLSDYVKLMNEDNVRRYG